MSQTINAQLANQPNPQFWRETILEGLGTPEKTYRRFMLIKPQLDYSRLEAVESPLKLHCASKNKAL